LPMDLIDEDRDLRTDLSAFALGALSELRDVLSWPQERRDALLRSWVRRPERADLAQLIAMADTDNVVRLRLLRTIRDLGVS
jgi:hypothetical protein